MEGYSAFSKMGKSNVFLNLKCFHKTNIFVEAAFLKNAFGQKVFINFSRNTNFQHPWLTWPVAKGTKVEEWAGLRGGPLAKLATTP